MSLTEPPSPDERRRAERHLPAIREAGLRRRRHRRLVLVGAPTFVAIAVVVALVATLGAAGTHRTSVNVISPSTTSTTTERTSTTLHRATPGPDLPTGRSVWSTRQIQAWPSATTSPGAAGQSWRSQVTVYDGLVYTSHTCGTLKPVCVDDSTPLAVTDPDTGRQLASSPGSGCRARPCGSPSVEARRTPS